ncbi:MAG: hypothetical protein ACAI38_24380 [Myxococcota bacterium]|nr:hypothetical protein [Myxococcota bacterium]
MTPSDQRSVVCAAALMALLVGCAAEGPDCAASLLYRESGYTLASPVGTEDAPTVIFSDPSGQAPDACHYARNQGDEFCTEDGGWVDKNPGQRTGIVTVTPLNHACGGYVVGSSYDLSYSFDQVPSLLWIEGWSNNQ